MQEIALSASLDLSGSQRTVGELNNALKESGSLIDKLDSKDLTIEQEFAALKKQIESTPIRVQNLNQQIEEYITIALKAGRASPIGKQALKEAANLKDQYVDIQAEVDRLANDGVKLQAALDLGSSVTAGFAAAQGVSALVGENEELEKTLVKVQAAQAVLVGVETIRKNLEKESTLILVAKNAVEKASVIGAKAMAAAQWLVNAAFGSFPGVLIVTAIVALGAAFVKFGGTIKKVLRVAFYPFIKAYELLKSGIDAVLVGLGLQASEAEKAAQRQKSAARQAAIEVIRQEEKKQEAIAKKEAESRAVREESFDFEIAKLKAAGKQTYEIEQEKLRIIVESTNKEIQARERALKASQEAFKKQFELLDSVSGFYDFVEKDRTEKFKQRQKEIEDLHEKSKKASQQLIINQIKQETKLNNERKKQAEKANTEAKKQEEKAKNDQKQREQDQIEAYKLLEDLRLQAMQDGFERERILRAQEFDKQIAELEAKGTLSNELKIALEKSLIADLNEIDRQQKEEEAQKKLEHNQKLKEIDDKKTQQRIANEQKRQAAVQSIVSGSFSILSDLNNTFILDEKKREKIKKGLALADIARDTALAISSLMKNSEANVANAATFGAAGIAQFISGMARITANVLKAKQVLFSKSTPSISSSLGGGSIAVNGPRINPVTNGSTIVGGDENSARNSLIKELKDFKVNVVETDISSTQSKVSVIENQATIE